ncbi:MAG TPA: ABC transporter substrate-binding protein [Thermoanaerobaculia bacterium]|nr:ABC transporter substrate-binding protein [Thermoanaerobaculia bacterium]
MRRVVVALFLLCALACQRETPAPPPPHKPVSNGPQDGGRIVRRVLTNVDTLNYVLQTLEEERQVLAYLYDPLIDLDQNLNPIPGTAAKWEVLDGGKTYVLHLDPRATFSDGTPVLASDVVFTLNKILDEESVQFSSWFENLDRAKTAAVDARSVRVAFTTPRVGQLLSFNLGILPEHVYGKGDFKKNTKVVGNGPYLLKRRDRRGILLERREDYWREKPHVQSVLFRPIADDTVALNAMKRGEVDVAYVSNDQWFKIKDDPAIQSKFDFRTAWLNSYNCILWNLSDPLFADARVRRALAMAFDRQKVIDNLFHGQARPVTGPFTPDSWANDPRVLPIDYNPQGATAMLATAGWTDSDHDGALDRAGQKFAFTLLIPTGSKSTSDQAQVYQESLRAIGIAMEIRALDSSAYFEQMSKRNFQAAFTAWVNEPDPDPYGLLHSSQIPPNGFNVVGYANAEADSLMDRARMEFDAARRADLYHELHQILARDQPYLFMVQVGTKWAVSRRVQNAKEAAGVGLFLWRPGPYAWWVRE